MAEFVEVRGLRELSDALKALPKKLERRVLKAALMTGAREIANEAKLRVPFRTGAVRRNIRARPGRPDQGHNATVIVSVRKLTGRQISRLKAKGKRVDDPFHWRFVEFGTSKMPARPFMRPAFESKKVSAAHSIKDALKRRIEVEAAKLRRWAR